MPQDLTPLTPTDNRQTARSQVVLIARARRMASEAKTVADLREPAYGVAIQNVSRSGLSFLTDHSFVLGDVVEIDVVCKARRLILNGTVRHTHLQKGSQDVHAVGVLLLRLPGTMVPADCFDSLVQS